MFGFYDSLFQEVVEGQEEEMEEMDEIELSSDEEDDQGGCVPLLFDL